jgi:hypothetical protein
MFVLQNLENLVTNTIKHFEKLLSPSCQKAPQLGSSSVRRRLRSRFGFSLGLVQLLTVTLFSILDTKKGDEWLMIFCDGA